MQRTQLLLLLRASCQGKGPLKGKDTLREQLTTLLLRCRDILRVMLLGSLGGKGKTRKVPLVHARLVEGDTVPQRHRDTLDTLEEGVRSFVRLMRQS